ncbi:unnamed protein product [Caretta caretta]
MCVRSVFLSALSSQPVETTGGLGLFGVLVDPCCIVPGCVSVCSLIQNAVQEFSIYKPIETLFSKMMVTDVKDSKGNSHIASIRMNNILFSSVRRQPIERVGG